MAQVKHLETVCSAAAGKKKVVCAKLCHICGSAFIYIHFRDDQTEPLEGHISL